jgi:hypothetical protein
VLDAYALPHGAFVPEIPWRPATVERWSDRVVVQVVAPATTVERAPFAVLAPGCGWVVETAAGKTATLRAGRADDGEGVIRCYLLFAADEWDRPVALRGALHGEQVRASLLPDGENSDLTATDVDAEAARVRVLTAFAAVLRDPHALLDIVWVARDADDAQTRIAAHYGIEDAAACAVLDMQLRRMTEVGRGRLANELRAREEEQRTRGLPE